MKSKRIFLPILSIVIMLILNVTKTYAIMPHKVYNEVNLAVSAIMRLAVLILIIVYIIFAIIYSIKSKKDKREKRKTLIIWLIISIIAVIVLYFGADMVLEAGIYQ